MYFDYDRLTKLATDNSEQYQSADPFPYIALDDIAHADKLQGVLDAFPTPEQLTFYKYENPLEKKLAMDQLSKLPEPIVQILLEMNSAPFLNFLEKLSGIEGLIPDPYYRGGGIHQIERGGKLDVHIDFNIHPKLKLQRRLNVLLYLNQDWDESYGGHFELWRGHKEGTKHVLDECTDKILPIFNRFAMFSTSEKSYHGHPERLACPEDRTRKSIALYYYTVDRPDDEKADAHSTTFIKRPEDADDAEIEKMREVRNQGRLSSNV